MTDEDRDTVRADQLHSDALIGCMEQNPALHEAVRAGDADAMRAAYKRQNGRVLGTESLVLEEVLRNSDLPLSLLGVLFRELGGQFFVDVQFNVCVFSALIGIESRSDFPNVQEVDRWTRRVAEVVRYLVGELNLPIHMRQRYSVSPQNRDVALVALTVWNRRAALIALTLDWSCWACYNAFTQFIRPDPVSVRLERVLYDNRPGVRTEYWVRRLAAEAEGENVLSEAMSGYPRYSALLNAEGVRRMQAREEKQLLLLMQKEGSDVWRRAVMAHHTLSQLILTQAFEGARFFRVSEYLPRTGRRAVGPKE